MAKKPKGEVVTDADADAAGIVLPPASENLFVSIKRKAPGSHLYSWWRKNVPLESVDNLQDWIYAEGGRQYEFKFKIHDRANRPALDASGKAIPEGTLPALEQPAPGNGSAVSIDRDIQDRQNTLRRREVMLDLERREAQLKRDEKEVKRMAEGKGDEEDDDYVFNPMLGGWFPKNHPMAQGGGYGMPPPWMQQPKEDSTLKTLVPVICAWIARPTPQNPMADPAFIKLLMGEKMSPKDLIGMFAPMVAEMGKASSEANRTAMASMAEMDKEIKLRMLDAIMTDPSKDQNEVNKWRQWLGLGKEVLKDAVGVVKSAVTSDGKKDQAKIEKRQAPGLPAPKKEGEKSAEPVGDEKAGGTEAGGEAAGNETASPEDPKAKAEELKKARVTAFLTACEEEALAESNPIACADKLGELYDFLPRSIREKIEEAMTGEEEPTPEAAATVMDSMKSYCPEIVARIIAAVVADESGTLREFYSELLDALANPEEEEPQENEAEEEKPE